MKFMIRAPTFHEWNPDLVNFTCELGISYAKTFPFPMWNENFICENVPIPYVFHMWNDMRNFCKGCSLHTSGLQSQRTKSQV